MKFNFAFALSLCLFFTTTALAKIQLPLLLSDGLVLQREAPVHLWGQADPGEKVNLLFQGLTYRSSADEQGNWSITLPPQPAGGPHVLRFSSRQQEITVQDVLFGDVWICAGQSNMVLPMERVKENYPTEVANDHFPAIRHFFIPTTTDLQGPRSELTGSSWKTATNDDLLSFSATAYFFAKAIYQQTQVPIGLVNASVGGTPIEAWISEAGFQDFPHQLGIISRNKEERYTRQFTERPGAVPDTEHKDKGLLETPKWYDPAYRPKNWHNFSLPGFWEDQGVRNLNGVVWFRKEIEVPVSMTGQEVKLFMGRIIDADEVYVNGQKVGNITYQYPPRRYTVPAGLLKTGKNIITVRVTNYQGKGGFVPDKNYALEAENQRIDLTGYWQYRVGEVFEPAPSTSTYDQFWAQRQPAALYNAMVAPLTRLKVKGFLWYQGESNLSDPAPYVEYLPALIRDWRQQFDAPRQPFLFVQLANYGDVDYLPTESNWAVLRDAQRQALEVENTAMAVAIDLGEWNDIHPLNKKGVGDRLALGALQLAYQQDLVYAGPLLASARVEGAVAVLDFAHVGSGLVAIDEEPLAFFELAGQDGRFYRAVAKIEGSQVLVQHRLVPAPCYVRYAWADNPRGANLYNREGLPASPFQVTLKTAP